LYFPDTAILITRFMTPEGVCEVVDFMPIVSPERATDHHQLVRLVRVVRGEMEFTLECEPRFDYGRARHEIAATDGGVILLARSGRLEEARLTFEKMLTYANHVGLFSEEIGPTGGQLGNFPQAFTHLSLINAAMNLDFQLDHGSGWVDLVESGSSAR
jgi:GH15 family glucan-1,4-alpha-glucosidase